MKQRATIKHIAESLNLSVSTVSRILNGKGEFSEVTKSSVLRVAKMLDYRANTLAVSLRKKVSNKVIGVILPQVNHYFFSSILNGIMVSSHNKGYAVMIGESLDQFELEKNLINNFIDHFVAGIILAPSQNEKSMENIKKMERDSLPNVVIDRTYERKNGSFVKHNDYIGAYNAVKQLISNGYEKISIIKGPDHCTISQRRFEGYKEALSDSGIPLNSKLCKAAKLTVKQEGYSLFKELYEQEKPDAVFAITDQLASGVYEYAFNSQLKIPDDLGVIGYSNSEIAEMLRPKLTSVNQSSTEMGQFAFEFLIDQLGENRKSNHKVFDSNLVIRDSCGPKKIKAISI